jgi:hypothetical protein
MQVVELVQTKVIESEVEQRLVASLPSDFEMQGLHFFTSSSVHAHAIKNGLVHRSDEQLTALHEGGDNMLGNKDTTTTILKWISENDIESCKKNWMPNEKP